MKIAWLAVLLLPVTVFAQQSVCPCSFKGYISGGAIIGEKETKAFYQLSGGMSFQDDSYYTGIGIGIDRYRFNSIPVFADLQMNFGKKKMGFLYANLGYNIPYDNKEDAGSTNVIMLKNRYGGGLYAEAGAGKFFRINKQKRIAASIGYSYKRINNFTEFRYSWCSSCDIEKYTYQYDFKRLAAKLSLVIGK